MKKIHILAGKVDSPNGISFLWPFLKFKKDLFDMGYEIFIFFNHAEKRVFDCDILFLDCRYAYNFGESQELKLCDYIVKNKSHCSSLFFFDNSDSTGTLFENFLEICDVYLKNQVLIKLDDYKKKFYGGRIYTSYFNRNFKIKDDDDFLGKDIKSSDIRKIQLGWNSCYNDWSLLGGYKQKLVCKFKFLSGIYLLKASKKIYEVNQIRDNNVSLRIRLDYPRNTISFHRKKIAELIKNNTKKINRLKYLKEMGTSKVTVSPFGFGEISLRDFEVFLTGSLLLKPSMSHMKTWPDLYKEEQTMVSFDWKGEKLMSKIEEIVENYDNYKFIAVKGQNNFLKYTASKESGKIFAKRFDCIIKTNYL